jgi:ATP-binding cassette subfamily B protein
MLEYSKKIKLIRQREIMDCGPTCLKMVAKYYGKTFSIETLRNLSQFQRNGVSLLGLSQAAEKIGFQTVGCKLSYKQISTEVQFPCIIHWNQNHFVVVESIKNNKVKIADPANTTITLTANEFIKNWITTITEGENAGIALLLKPSKEFYKLENEKESKVGFLLRIVLRRRRRLCASEFKSTSVK